MDELGEEIRQRDSKMVAVDLPELKGPQAQHVCARPIQGEQSTPVQDAQDQSLIDLGPAVEQNLIDLNSDSSPVQV